MSRRRLLVVLGVIAVVLIALMAGLLWYGASAAGNKASGYDDDYAAWKAKDKPVLLAATAELPDDTYVFENDSTAKALAAQKKGCDAVAEARASVKTAAGRLPKMGDSGLLGTLSSDYHDAGARSDRRAKVVRKYVEAASKTLAQIERDCRWNISVNSTVAAPTKLFDKAAKNLLKPGDVEPGGIYCDTSADSCVSSIAKKKNAAADLQIEAVKLQRSTRLKVYQSKECAGSSYGVSCEALAAAFDARTKARLAAYEFIRKTKTSVNNGKIHEMFEKSDKVTKKHDAIVSKAVLALDPALKDNKALVKNPDWTDLFFAITAKSLLEKLDFQRSAIEKL